MRAALIAAALAGAILPGAASAAETALTPVACREDAAVLRRPDGSMVEIAVELADTPETRARGLMFREALPPAAGMLFIYEEPQPVAFWMRNTLIALDMLFIDATGRVRLVHERAVPHDETPIPGAAADDPFPDRLMVLEIAAGEAARLRLAEGTLLAHPRLDQGLAAQPCE